MQPSSLTRALLAILLGLLLGGRLAAQTSCREEPGAGAFAAGLLHHVRICSVYGQYRAQDTLTGVYQMLPTDTSVGTADGYSPYADLTKASLQFGSLGASASQGSTWVTHFFLSGAPSNAPAALFTLEEGDSRGTLLSLVLQGRRWLFGQHAKVASTTEPRTSYFVALWDPELPASLQTGWVTAFLTLRPDGKSIVDMFLVRDADQRPLWQQAMLEVGWPFAGNYLATHTAAAHDYYGAGQFTLGIPAMPTYPAAVQGTPGFSELLIFSGVLTNPQKIAVMNQYFTKERERGFSEGLLPCNTGQVLTKSHPGVLTVCGMERSVYPYVCQPTGPGNPVPTEVY